MSTNEINDLPEGEWAASDDELDGYLGLDNVDQNDSVISPLDIPMSAEQAAQVAQERELASQGLTTDAEGNVVELPTPDTSNPDVNVEPVDLISQLLIAKGVKDGLIKIEDETGEIKDVPFDELTSEEQFNILTAQTESPELNEQEQSTIDFLRKNNLTFEQAVDYFVKQAVDEATADAVATESIADLTDDAIYAFDLLSKYKNLTEDDIKLELEKQQEHPELFKKKVDALREEYLQLEKDQLAQKEADAQANATAEYEKIALQLVDVAKRVEDIGGIDLELPDKQDVLGFILNKDVNGQTEFGKLLDDPNQLFEIAWFAKKGKEAFDAIHDYYRKEITEASRKGYEKAKAELKPTSKVTTGKAVYKPKSQTQTNQPRNEQYPDVGSLYADVITTK